MNYSADLEKISIEDYKEILRSQNLLPGRKALHHNLDANFQLIKEVGIKNLAEFTKAVPTSINLKSFSEKTGISEDYLVLLKREASALEPKPVRMKDFPEINAAITDSLIISGIKTSKDYYELLGSAADCEKIALKLMISQTMAHELYCLCSLSRINGIGAAAAKCFFDAGYCSVSDIAEASAEVMLSKVSLVNAQKQYYKAKLGAKDMQFCIDYARILNRLDD